MIAPRLQLGQTVGIVSPSHVANPDRYVPIISGIQSKGFRVKIGKNLYKNTYGYAASEQERADDINSMIIDSSVRMIFFGGGEGGNELLPWIDYDAIVKDPKIFLSYSDGTSILNAVYCETGLETYYGQTPDNYRAVQDYTFRQFQSHIMEGNAKQMEKNSQWHTVCPGICNGILIGGYLGNFAQEINRNYLKLNHQKKYILFLEEHESFSCVARVSALLSYIEQSEFIHNVTGLLFGHYSAKLYPDLMARLQRFGERYQIPVSYCDDFGHGENYAILPIGRKASLDTIKNSLVFC